jgi:hypothetical protein
VLPINIAAMCDGQNLDENPVTGNLIDHPELPAPRRKEPPQVASQRLSHPMRVLR